MTNPNAFRFHHDHDHDHEHCHEHEHDCHECGGCDPMTETLALMQYMINHNAAHARELEGLAKKLGELGNEAAAQQVLAAVSEFEKEEAPCVFPRCTKNRSRPRRSPCRMS